MHHQREAAAVFQGAAETVAAPVRRRRQELADEMAGRERLDSVDPTFLAAPRRRTIGLHHPADVVLVHLFGDAAVERLAQGGRRDGGQPVAGIGIAAPAEMADLAHQRSALPMHALGELLEVRNNRVRADIELAKDVRRIPVDVGRAAEHGKSEPALGLFQVIALIGLLRRAADFQAAGVAGAHDAITQRQMLDRQRLQQRIFRRRHGSGCGVLFG